MPKRLVKIAPLDNSITLPLNVPDSSPIKFLEINIGDTFLVICETHDWSENPRHYYVSIGKVTKIVIKERAKKIYFDVIDDRGHHYNSSRNINSYNDSWFAFNEALQICLQNRAVAYKDIVFTPEAQQFIESQANKNNNID